MEEAVYEKPLGRRNEYLLRSQDAVTKAPKRYFSNRNESDAIQASFSHLKCCVSNQIFGGKVIRFAPSPKEPEKHDEKG